MENSRIFKIILLGDTATGKTSFIKNYTSHSKHKVLRPTERFECLTSVSTNPTRWVQIWDTPGQQKYRMMPQAIIHQFDYALVFYDITNRHTFKVAQEIVKNISLYNPEIEVLMIGNKADIAMSNQSKREVGVQEGAETAKSLGVHFIEHSFEERADNLITKLFNNKWSIIKTDNPNNPQLSRVQNEAQCRTCI